MKRLPTSAVLACALALIAAPIGAQADEARTQFERGLELYDDGKYEQAAVAFERAFELKPSYKILYNIAQVQNQLGHFAAALEAYARYLAEGGDQVSPDRQREVKAEIERLNSLVGMLVVQSEEDGAAVFVDGRREGETPLPGPVIVDLGEHELVVKRDGAELHRELVTVAGGQRVVVDVEAQEQGDVPVVPSGDGTDEEGGGRVWTWVFLGTGAAAAITGGVIGGVSMSKEKSLLDQCEGGHCPPSERDEGDSIEKMNLTADILYGVGAAFVVTGIVLFFVEPNGDEEPAVTVGPVASDTVFGLSLEGRF